MKRLIIAVLALTFTACNTSPIVEMGKTEYGVRFRMLPPMLGGGVSSDVIGNGQLAVVWPWDRIYRIDTKLQSLEWAARGQGAQPHQEDFVWTRALDGNEVALAVKVEYHVSEDPADLVRLVREIATSNQGVADIVTTIARADIRTIMNQLKTSEFFREKFKYEGQEKVLASMRDRLKKLGIIVARVNLGEHRFGDEYQEMINLIQTQDEQTNRETLRAQTVARDKEREKNDMQARVNRLLQEAEAYKQQAHARGDGYYSAKQNEALGILAKGRAEAQGVIEQVNALSGPGGRQILRLEIVRQLLGNDPRFVVMNEGAGGAALGVQRIDANDLLQQLGVFEAAGERRPQTKERGPAPAPPAK